MASSALQGKKIHTCKKNHKIKINKFKTRNKSSVAGNAFDLSIPEAEAGRSLSSRPVWSTEHEFQDSQKETLSETPPPHKQQTNKQKTM